MEYYFDTSIWLDFLEDRNEPNLPKGEWAHKLIEKIIKNDEKIIYSDAVLIEMIRLGYTKLEIDSLFSPLKYLLIYIESTPKQIGKAKDLSNKRNVPKKDALHALIARDKKAILVSLDRDFEKLIDIVKRKKPQELI